MTLPQQAASAPEHTAFSLEWRNMVLALLTVALLGAVVVLAAFVLDALKDLLARGSNASGEAPAPWARTSQNRCGPSRSLGPPGET